MRKRLLAFMMLISTLSFAKVNPGEIVILGFEGSNAVDEIWFAALAPIDAGEVIYFTDQTISGTAPFTLGNDSKDSWMSFTIGANGLDVGDTWVIGNMGTATPTLTAARSNVTTSDITNITTTQKFTLSFGQGGDDLILYQGSSTVATRFIYGIGADPVGGSGVSQFEPNQVANQTKVANWGLTFGLTANFFDNGSSNYKLLGVDPATVDFNGTIDDILGGLGDPASYVFDVGYTLNSSSTSGDLSLGTISPQPSNRFYRAFDGQWYTDAAFNTLAIDPNRTHTVVVVTTSYSLASGDTLDVAGIVVGDGSTPTVVTAGAGSVVQTVYGLQVTNAGEFVMSGTASVYLGSDVDVDAGGTATLQPGAHIDFEGDLIVDGTMTLNADATGFSSLGLHGTTTQSITGTGTINAELYFANSGWHHLSAPGSITFSNVSFTNGMNLSFSGATRNVYRWNPSPSSTDPGWYPTQSASNFGDSAYAIYFYPDNVPTTINLAYVADDLDADVSAGTHQHTAKYKAAGSQPVNSTDGWLSADASAGANGGWNLMKNPFWGHLNWASVDDNLPSDVSGAVYFWNPGSGSYDTWTDGTGNSNNDIIPLLAYFAKADIPANGQAINRSQSHVFDGDQNYFGKVSNAKAQMILNATSQGKTSTVYMLFEDNATAAFDHKYDAYFRGVNPDQVKFNVVSSDSVGLKIDQRPFPIGLGEAYLSYHFETDGAPGSINLDPSFLPRGIYVYLEDLHEGVTVDLLAGDYMFTQDADAPIQRFKLHINNTAVSLNELNAKPEELTAFRNFDRVNLTANTLADGAYTVEVIDMMGSILYNNEVEFAGGNAQFDFTGNGPFVIRVWNGEEALVVKSF
ncbi:hypothetical protein [Phaeocystidibacter luteus]|uniref:T9SS type A sorting domain-containing protein n=1 Tax=Phaeocystidibacter luteus TaxID=911197 RepID=A0A6N6RIT4_9FLAO|nr:hypothetical protein [Phaeocystidibacter luteus]KAB2810216.1 hypothetical protein F8C67_08255 [Phaeocystidibacter luteus]